ncbi:MAG: hypothetical protein AB7S39_13235 [Gemmatimonadales bacterium]
MKRILIPSKKAKSWKRLLAKPDLHWKDGRSAKSTALSWEAANDLPSEMRAALETGPADLRGLELQLAVPEWEVALPGGATASHTDVMALARNDAGLVAIAVEAKVDEVFGPTLGEKRKKASAGQTERLDYLHQVLGLPNGLPDSVRYQLLHRTASAVLIARAFHASTAVMMVQSFSQDAAWFDDFTAFGTALGVRVATGSVARVGARTGPALYLGWCLSPPPEPSL